MKECNGSSYQVVDVKAVSSGVLLSCAAPIPLGCPVPHIHCSFSFSPAHEQAEDEVPELVERWEECGCTKVCLKVNSEVINESILKDTIANYPINIGNHFIHASGEVA